MGKSTAQLQSAAASIREVLGPEETSMITDKEIRDTAWEYFFEVEDSVNYLLGVSSILASF
jgi:elongation factor 1 alpha-like protein